MDRIYLLKCSLFLKFAILATISAFFVLGSLSATELTQVSENTSIEKPPKSAQQPPETLPPKSREQDSQEAIGETQVRSLQNTKKIYVPQQQPPETVPKPARDKK